MLLSLHLVALLMVLSFNLNISFYVWVTLSLMGYVTPFNLIYVFILFSPIFYYIINQLL
jgi:hypothetical protein